MTTFSSDKQHIHLLSDDKGKDTSTSNIVQMVEKTGKLDDHVTLKEVVKNKVDTAIEQKADYDRNKDVMQFVDNTNNFLRIKSTTNADFNHQLIATLQELVMASQSDNFHLCLGLFNIGRDIFEHIDRTRLQLKFGKGSEATNDYNNNVDKTHNDILRDIIKNNQSKEGLRHLLNLWNMLNHSFYDKLDSSMNDPSIVKILNDAKRIANSHVGDRSIDLFLLRVRAIISLVENDKELGDFVKEVQSYLKDVIDKPDVLRGDDYRIKGLKFYGKAVEFARKYQNDPDLRSVIYDGQIFADYHFKVPQQEDIVSKIANVPFSDEFLPTLKKEIIPFLASKLKEIPVKGFKISNPDFEHLLVDDIFVSVDDILPDHIGIKSENTAVVKMNDSQDPLKAHSVLSVQIYGLRLIVKDFYFSFKRKTPIIDFSDEGRGSINLKGEGLTIFIKYDLNVDAKRTIPVLQTGTVDVKLDNFDLDFTEANHKIILNVASSLFKPAVEKEITNAVKLNIEQYVTELANLLNKQLANFTK